MMNQVYTTLPDDRPITAICIVENIDKCPKGFTVVSRTYDQDSDADLWRDGSFFSRRCTRYLCLSKTEGAADRVVNCICLVSEKEQPPDGYTISAKTFDSGQKAWRKKRLCYKTGHSGSSCSAVTDIIVLSRMKEPPEEFNLCGEINGVTLCYKLGKSQQPMPYIPYSIAPAISPGNAVSPNADYVNTTSQAPATPTQSHDYVILRRAPLPPPPNNKQFSSNTYATISGLTGLEGVSFILNPAFSFLNESSSFQLSVKCKTSAQIDEEYNYNFRTERET